MAQIAKGDLQEFLLNSTRPIIDRGVIDSGSTTTTLVISGVSWMTNQYMGASLEIATGTLQGNWTTIVGNTNNTITVSPALPSTPQVGSEIIIVPGNLTTSPEKFNLRVSDETVMSYEVLFLTSGDEIGVNNLVVNGTYRIDGKVVAGSLVVNGKLTVNGELEITSW